MSVIAQQTRKADKECHKHRLRAQQSNMQPDLRKLICEHIIRVLQHQKDINHKQHICVKHDFVRRHTEPAERRSARLEDARLRTQQSRSAATDLVRYQRNGCERVRIAGIRTQRTADLNLQYHRLAFRYNPAIDYSSSRNVVIGQMSHVCTYCQALKFNNETKGMCCAGGKSNCLTLKHHQSH
ncbi:uncharacterized protein TNCV_753761 [Trichonephila clavipes]|nr:uncharacterized protein TNCV_753761 [Trichonephila clavipes]